MRLARMAVIVLVGMATQSCRIEMPPLVELIGMYSRATRTPGTFPYDFGESRAIALQRGFKDTLVITDKADSGHGKRMKAIMTGMRIPGQNIAYTLSYSFFIEDSSFYSEARTKKTRVVHIPLEPFFGRVPGVKVSEILDTDNMLFIYAAGNTITRSEKGDRDLYREEHVYWERKNFDYSEVVKGYQTGKVLAAASAQVVGQGAVIPETGLGEIIPQYGTVQCGDIKEACFTVIPGQTTSDASARLSAMAFYLSQLYPTVEGVRETLEVCAVDIGEPGIDREYGRGIANLLCPRVLEKEVDIVSQYLKEKGEVFTPKAGDLTGSWEARNIPLQVYIPVVLRETIQVQYQGTTNGTIRFSGENQVSADITLSAEVQVVFLLNIDAVAKDTVQIEGTYTAQESALTLKGEKTSFAYTYTATEDSLYLVRSLTMNEALALVPGSIGELAGTVTKDLLADDPIRITAKFVRMPDTPGVPQTLRMTTITENAVTLNWEAPAETGGAAIERYRISLCADSNCSDSDILETKETERQEIVFSDLSPATQYYIRIQAKNAAGWGVWSMQVPVMTTERKLPADFNRNGIVDFADYLLFVATYGAREGDPAYNPWMDFDKDGAITFSDFLIFTAAFGQTG